jgi:hypothetical protein
MQQPSQQRDLWSILDGCQGCFGTLAVIGIFFLVGAGLSVWGWTILQNARASASWPTAQGRITRMEVTHSTDSEGGDSYRPEVAYEYLVNDRSYESYTIKFGENSYGNRREAEEIAARYPVGQSVPVYYDPADPERSVLEPGVSLGSYIVLGIGVLFVAISLIVGPIALIFRGRG